MKQNEIILEARHLKKYFKTGRKLLRAVDDVSFFIRKGETLGLVGESGCGKTTCGRTCIGIYERTDGEVLYKGKDIHALQGKEQRDFTNGSCRLFSRIPILPWIREMKVGEIIAEGLRAHKLCPDKASQEKKVRELLETVGLNAEHADAVCPRILRRPAAADRHRQSPGGGAGAHRLRRAHLRPGRVHPGADCKPADAICRKRRGSPTSLSPTTLAWSSISPTGSASCTWAPSRRSPPPPPSMQNRCIHTPRRSFGDSHPGSRSRRNRPQDPPERRNAESFGSAGCAAGFAAAVCTPKISAAGSGRHSARWSRIITSPAIRLKKTGLCDPSFFRVGDSFPTCSLLNGIYLPPHLFCRRTC